MSVIEDDHASAAVPAIVFEHVSLAFDDNVVVEDVSFSVRPGATLFLLGASGSGKSVTLKLILGLLKPDAGVMRIDNMSGQELLSVRGDIGMLSGDRVVRLADRRR
jgi:phospholipid/cholesterol/gamma-HCH transport system ATP-binding protein